MNVRKYLAAAGAVAATGAWLGFGGSAAAAFPDFSRCPTTHPDLAVCVDIQNTSGTMSIKGFEVPLGDSLAIRGGISTADTGNVFLPPRNSTGLFAEPVNVPGGLLGINFPIPGNSVLATAELAGSPSSIGIDITTNSIRIPLKLKLSNFLLGMACHIGSNARPVHLNLITGTTNPPAPNRPISGQIGRIAIDPASGAITIRGNNNVDNSFAVPASSTCGLGLGLINGLVNAKLRLPSAAGNNSISVIDDIALKPVGGL